MRLRSASSPAPRARALPALAVALALLPACFSIEVPEVEPTDPTCEGEACNACTSSDTCTDGKACIAGRCQDPATCDRTCPAVLECGSVVNDCGERIDCGSCGEGRFCDETLGRCVALGKPGACAPRACGIGVDPAGDPFFCGACATGEACEAGACVAVTRPFCWSAPQPLTYGSDPYDAIADLRLVVQDDVPWLWATFLPERSGPVSASIKRVRLTTRGTVSEPPLDLDDDQSRDVGTGFSPTGDELVHATDLGPDLLAFDLLLRVREVDGGFGVPQPLPPELELDDAGDDLPCYSPVWLPDGRTLLYSCVSDSTPQLRVARRSAATPGTTDFVRVPLGSLEGLDDDAADDGAERVGRSPISVTCDGSRIVYRKDVVLPNDAWVTQLWAASWETTAEGLSLPQVERYLPEGSPLQDAMLYGAVETPDCSRVLTSVGMVANFEVAPQISERVPCP